MSGSISSIVGTGCVLRLNAEFRLCGSRQILRDPFGLCTTTMALVHSVGSSTCSIIPSLVNRSSSARSDSFIAVVSLLVGMRVGWARTTTSKCSFPGRQPISRWKTFGIFLRFHSWSLADRWCSRCSEHDFVVAAQFLSAFVIDWNEIHLLCHPWSNEWSCTNGCNLKCLPVSVPISCLKSQLTRSKRWALSSIVKLKGFLAASVSCSIVLQISFEDEIAGSGVYLKLDKTIAAHRHCWKSLSAWRFRYHFQDFFFCLVFRVNVSYCKNFHLALLEAAAVNVVSDQLVNSRSRVLAVRWRLVPADFPEFARFTNCWKMILSSTQCTFSSISEAQAQSTFVCSSAVITMSHCDSENVVWSSHVSGNSVGSSSGLHMLYLLTGDWRTPAIFYTSLEVKFVFCK